jgi:hydrogenase expression/formation protein HypE
MTPPLPTTLPSIASAPPAADPALTHSRRLGRVSAKEISLAHGGGGKAMKDLIDDVFLSAFDNAALAPLEDQPRIDLASLNQHGDRLAFTTDSFIVDPLFFPGGDIGKLAVCGTINDLAVTGATPLYLSCAAIIEEGLPVDLLRRVARSMAESAREVGVRIVTGDTKVAPRGTCDKLFLTTTGIGTIPRGVDLSVANARAGDIVIVSGVLGDHAAAILAARGDVVLEPPIASDCVPLHQMIQRLLAAAPGTRTLRDATRGGIANVLNEIATASNVDIEIEEGAIEIRPQVRAMALNLGIDPLSLANEGKIVAIVPANEADAALNALQAHAYGQDASLIGFIVASATPRVLVHASSTEMRVLDMAIGGELPRIG